MKPIALLAAALLALGVASVSAATTPGEIVAQRSNQVIDTLVQRRDEFRQDQGQLFAFIRSELREVFDREYSARLVLARHGRDADPEQISAFAEALADNLMRRYGTALLDFDPDVKVKVTGETPLRDGALMRVASEIQRRGAPAVPVDYMFRRVGEDWLMFDVIVEGVSYVQTYRSQFDELLRRQSLEQVTARLREGSLDVDA